MTNPVQRDLPDRIGAYEILELVPTPDHFEHYLGVTVVEFVTLTILRADPAKAAQAAREIARSARLASTVAGEEVVRTFRAEREGDVMFIVGQHLQGRWLTDVMSSAGKLEPKVALRVLLDVAAGLGSIHSVSAVHGDVRPATVLLCEDGRARLALLGIGPVAPLLALPEGAKSARAPYRPPEELRGRAASQAGDLYSFGVLLHELFAGTISSVGQDGALAAQVAEVRRNGAPDVLSNFLSRLLSHTASARPTSARVVLDVLEEAAVTLVPASREQMIELVASMASIPPPAPARARAPIPAPPPAPDPGPAVVDAAAPSIRQPVVAPTAGVVKAPPPIPADAARIAMATPPPPPRTVSVARPPPPVSGEGGTPVRFPPPPGKPARIPPPSPPGGSARPPVVLAPVRDTPLAKGEVQLEGPAATGADGSAPVQPAEKTLSWAGVPAEGGGKKDDAGTDGGKKAEVEVEKIEPKKDQAKTEATNETKEVERRKDETKKDEIKRDDSKRDETKSDETKSDETKSDETKKDDARRAKPTGASPAGAASETPKGAATLEAAPRPFEQKTKAARTPIPSARPGRSQGLPAWLLVLLTLAAGAAIGAFFGLRERANVEREDRDTRRNRVNEAAPEPVGEPAPGPTLKAPAVPASPDGGQNPVPPAEPASRTEPGPRTQPASKTPAQQPRVSPPSKAPRPGAPGPAAKAGPGGTLQISCARPCQVRIDGAASAQSTTSGARVSGGSHAVVVTDSQTRATRTLRVYVPAGVTVRRTVRF